MKKDELLWVLIATGAGVVGFFLVLITCGNWERDGKMLMLLAGIVCGLIIVFTSLYFFLAYWKKRRKAMNAMGRHSLGIILRDKVAKTAYKGIYAFLDGKLNVAEELLMRALSLADVRNNQLFCVEWLARLYEQADDGSKLLWCHRKAVEYAPENPEFQSRLGHDYYVEGRLEQAMYCFEQALKYDPNNGFSRYSIAKIHAVRGDDKKAIELLEELSGIQENHPLVYAELATLYAMNSNDDKCHETYEKAILCGYDHPEKLAARMTAIYAFNNAEKYSGTDLPRDYYRYIEKDEE